ncbi:hypothetical protein IID24_00040 [Patescibacteria group bacterium]|nr:hypothetical protein [Patescibacteria group bacterium]
MNQKLFIIVGGILAILGAGWYGYTTFMRNSGSTPVTTQQPRVELIKEFHSDWYGDIYYVDKQGNRMLIAQSDELPDGPVISARDVIRYTEATISPNQQWIGLEAACWEDSCPQVYDIASGEIHYLTSTTPETSESFGWGPENLEWLPDSRIRSQYFCPPSKNELCGTYESKDSVKPWELQLQ